jgi:TIR domain
MTRVFISHCAEDNYFVDFLVELLRFHRVGVWVDQSNLAAGADFTAEIEQGLADCDAMILVISRNSPKSKWITRELTHFRAVNADRPVIPLVLDAAADPDAIYEGLKTVTQLRCYESYLECFRELLRLLDRPLFPDIENRKIPDRRAGGRREQPVDRRKSPVERRLRVAMDDYIESTGRDLLAPMSRWRDVSCLVQDLTAPGSPLQSFDFVDRKTSEQVPVDFEWLRRKAHISWRAKSEKDPDWGVAAGQLSRHGDEDLTGAAYIIDDLIDEIVTKYIVTSNDRRSAERRRIVSRRAARD